MGLDRQLNRLPARREPRQRAACAVDLVADAADIDDDPALAGVVDQPLELADHRAASELKAARVSAAAPR